MSLLRSFGIGISGLNASGAATSVIGDNIANAGTIGFKASRAEFQDVLATSLKGVDGGDQFGAGTRLGHIKQLFTQGDISRTDNITDLALIGDGLFVIEANFGRGFSRDGSMHFNKYGELVNASENKVQGFEADYNGKITSKLGPIKIGSNTIPAKFTQKIDVQMNINSTENIKEDFNLEDVDEGRYFNHSVTVYDNIGIPRIVNIFYNKVADNVWEYHALVDAKDAARGGAPGTLIEMAKGELIFNENGLLEEEISRKNSFHFNRGAASDQQIIFDWGESFVEGGNGLNATTQYGSPNSVSRHNQDGHSASVLKSLSFNDEGIIEAVYNNGVTKNIAQIAVAKFNNNEGLFKIGKNLFKQSARSGQAIIGSPGTGGRGDVMPKSLELSNVDIAHEFVSLLNSQRNFEANTKVIKTASEMLDEVLSIKR